MSPVIARSAETPRPPGPPRPLEVPPPPSVPPQPHVPVVPVVPVVPLRPPTAHVTVPHVPMRRPRWEYKHVTRPADAPDMDDAELNALGREGWELVGVVAGAKGTRFYFKRERT
jgi:hypothetical protein